MMHRRDVRETSRAIEIASTNQLASEQQLALSATSNNGLPLVVLNILLEWRLSFILIKYVIYMIFIASANDVSQRI